VEQELLGQTEEGDVVGRGGGRAMLDDNFGLRVTISLTVDKESRHTHLVYR
jgi:hypothetical protein